MKIFCTGHGCTFAYTQQRLATVLDLIFKYFNNVTQHIVL